MDLSRMKKFKAEESTSLPIPTSLLFKMPVYFIENMAVHHREVASSPSQLSGDYKWVETLQTGCTVAGRV
jgi:hypothetical protein